MNKEMMVKMVKIDDRAEMLPAYFHCQDWAGYDSKYVDEELLFDLTGMTIEDLKMFDEEDLVAIAEFMS